MRDTTIDVPTQTRRQQERRRQSKNNGKRLEVSNTTHQIDQTTQTKINTIKTNSILIIQHMHALESTGTRMHAAARKCESDQSTS